MVSWNTQADRMVGGTANKLQHQLSAAARTVFCGWHCLSFPAPFTEMLCLNYCTTSPIPSPNTLVQFSTFSPIFSTLTGFPGLLFLLLLIPSFSIPSRCHSLEDEMIVPVISLWGVWETPCGLKEWERALDNKPKIMKRFGVRALDASPLNSLKLLWRWVTCQGERTRGED